MSPRREAARPLPRELLDWQVALRRRTMFEDNGAPHAGVAPLVIAGQPGFSLGACAHSIICGLLPRHDLLEARTDAFRNLYERHVQEGARAVYDRGIEYLKTYYDDPGEFDPTTITTLLPQKLPLVDALRAERACALVFYVFDLRDRSETGRFRCLHLDCSAEVLSAGDVYDNVWWHNTLFHGPADDHVVVRFRHRATWDTRFGALDEVAS